MLMLSGFSNPEPGLELFLSTMETPEKCIKAAQSKQ